MKKVSLEDIASWWLAAFRGDKQGNIVSGVKQHHKAASISIELHLIPVLAKVRDCKSNIITSLHF